MRTQHGLGAWIRKGVLAVADQGLMSGSNFVLSILLARWLSPEQYGAYALAFSFFYLISTVHQALLLEPMSVLGPSEYAGRRSVYLGAMLWFQLAFSVLVVATVGVAAWVAAAMGDRNLASALCGLMLGAPGILLFWLARVACYIELAPATAITGAILYSVTLLTGAWALLRFQWISAVSVFFLMGAAAALVAGMLLLKMRPALNTSRTLLRDAAMRHWTYGRWALGSSLVIWVPGNIFYSITTAVLGIGSAGAFRALMNLTYPVTHTASALSMLFQPQLSATAANQGARSTVRPVMRVAMLYASGAVAWLAIVAFRPSLIWNLLYKGRFQDASPLLVWMLVGVVFQVTAYVPAIGLRALQAPWLVFSAYSIAAISCIAVGIPATRLWGLPGAVGAYSGSLVLSFSAAVMLYRRSIRKSEGRWQPASSHTVAVPAEVR